MDVVATARAIQAAHTRGEDIVSVLVTGGAGAGARYLSRAAGQLEGHLDEQLDDAARALADEVWRTRAPAHTDLLFAELHALAESLVVFGAGHIAVPLAHLADELGFRVTVLDDREEFARPARFAGGIAVERLDLTNPLNNVEITRGTYVLLLTRAHKHDFDCLRAVLNLPVQPRYIGMIGSQRRVRAAFTALLAGGIRPDQLETVHAPVGLEIGAETPAEIAVSIAAELIQVRRSVPPRGKAQQARVLDRMLPESSLP